MADQRTRSHRQNRGSNQAYQATASSALSLNAATTRSGYQAPTARTLTPDQLPGRSAASHSRQQAGYGTPNGSIPYKDPALTKSYIGDVPSSDQYGSLSKTYTIVGGGGPQAVRNPPLPQLNPPGAGSSSASLSRNNVAPWPQSNGKRPSSSVNNYAIDSFLSNRNDPYGYVNGPRSRYY